VADMPRMGAPLAGLFGRHDLAVDLGTANTVVFVRGRGVVLFEPSVVAIDEQADKLVAVGAEASRMIGRTPATIRAVRPLRDGVIADFEVTEQMLRHFIRRAVDGNISSARVMLCVPSLITEVERRALEEAALGAGARAAYLIEESMAAAIGSGLPVADPAGSMIVDIGGGTTEVAVISLGGPVVWDSIRVGGYEMDDAIVRQLRNEGKLLIGPQAAENVKIEIGSVGRGLEDEETEVSGRDMLTGLLRRARITSSEVRRAIGPAAAKIVDSVHSTLERTPPELAADVSDRGIMLAGGGALLKGLDELLRAETGLPVTVAEQPLMTVAVGAGRALEELDSLDHSSRRRSRKRRRARL
jgi:rod shape-determining protein MreB